MKTIFCLCIMAISFSYSFSQKTKDSVFTLTGKITNSNYPVVYLIYKNKDGVNIQDSCMLNGEDFSFKGFINEPTFAVLRNSTLMDDGNNPNTNTLFLEPLEMTAEVVYNNFKELKITGSTNNYSFDTLKKQWSSVDKNSPDFDDQFIKIDSDFMLTHPYSYVSAYILNFYKRTWPLEKVKSFYNDFAH